MAPLDEDAPTEVVSTRAPSREAGTRFLPGTMLDRRYRIVAPLGRGGMGLVYRADDVKLGQTVALKFLPPELERNPERLAMLFDEVKLARQVSHPNVCRVWDAGEADGLHFIAMEFVDGEDLASLLRRVGHLPEERALQVARELCEGLHAIHEQGLLHRDLKPANVLIDGRGRVRIADFGLAAVAGAVQREAIASGTPAYMAPEQFAEREVTVRSDVYALGMVLHELFTGRRPGESDPAPSRTVTSRTTSTADPLARLDPAIERAIRRCLQPDPAVRPASALQVAGSLPGGDPIAYALAAGETPSPEMVAAAGGIGGVRAPVAAAIVVLALALLASVLMLTDRRDAAFWTGAKPFAALRDRASDFARALGADANGADREDGIARFPRDGDAASVDVNYWYRTSPHALPIAVDIRGPGSILAFALPAIETPGESGQRRKLDGRLVEYRRIPLSGDSAASGSPDFGPLFAAAGLDRAACLPSAATRRLPVPAAIESAWVLPAASGARIAYGAAVGSIVTGFVVGEPVTPPVLSMRQVRLDTLGAIGQPILFALFVLLAVRNLRTGRADSRGAIRFGVANLLFGFLGYQLFASPTPRLLGKMTQHGLSETFYYSIFAVATYLATEPILRRRHPEWLASWVRLLDGRWRDPLFGRHLLIGTLGGMCLALVSTLTSGFAGRLPVGDIQSASVGGWTAFALVLRGLNVGTVFGLIFALLVGLLQLATRHRALGWIVWVPLCLLLTGVTRSWPTPVFSVATTLAIPVLLRFGGITSVAAALGTSFLFNEEFLTADFSSGHAAVSVSASIAVAVLLAWGVTAAMRTPQSEERARFDEPAR